METLKDGRKADYIGDGVYAVWDGFGIELRVSEFFEPSNVVYLEPEVLEALDRFYEAVINEE